MLSFFLDGGFMMWPLLIASVIVVAIIIDRFVYFKKAEVNEIELFENVKDKLRAHGPEAAIAYSEECGGPISSILKAGLKEYGKDRQRIEESFEREALIVLPELRKYLPALGTIGSVATLMGFTGTVMGMINAFTSIAVAGTTSPSIVAGGIAEALTTTATGLIIAIFSLVFYHYFNHRSEKILLEVEKASRNLMDLMEDYRGV